MSNLMEKIAESREMRRIRENSYAVTGKGGAIKGALTYGGITGLASHGLRGRLGKSTAVMTALGGVAGGIKGAKAEKEMYYAKRHHKKHQALIKEVRELRAKQN